MARCVVVPTGRSRRPAGGDDLDNRHHRHHLRTGDWSLADVTALAGAVTAAVAQAARRREGA
jgi:hypothetical protein